MTAFTSYVAESRSRGTTLTVISKGALLEAERHRQALGDITPITTTGNLWARAAEDLSWKPCKAFGIELLASSLERREQAVNNFIADHHALEAAELAAPDFGRKAVRRVHARVVAERMGVRLRALDEALKDNAAIIEDIARAHSAAAQRPARRAEADDAPDSSRRKAPPGPGN